jgi:hypothetical protein
MLATQLLVDLKGPTGENQNTLLESPSALFALKHAVFACVSGGLREEAEGLVWDFGTPSAV